MPEGPGRLVCLIMALIPRCNDINAYIVRNYAYIKLSLIECLFLPAINETAGVGIQ